MFLNIREAAAATARPKPAPGMRLQPTPQPSNGQLFDKLVQVQLVVMFQFLIPAFSGPVAPVVDSGVFTQSNDTRPPHILCMNECQTSR